MRLPISWKGGEMSGSRTEVKLKKAPGAPRRFKSSFMFFSTENHKIIREELNAQEGAPKKISTTEVAKLVSQRWKALSEEDRAKWDDLANKDKARYEMEKAMYNGPWKVEVSRRASKDPRAPKRPMSAFLSFSNTKRSEVRTEHVGVSNADISKILAILWKSAPEQERKLHIDKEFKLRQEYKKSIAEWREKHALEQDTKRKDREDEALRAIASGQRPESYYTQHQESTSSSSCEHQQAAATEYYDNRVASDARPTLPVSGMENEPQTQHHHAYNYGYYPPAPGYAYSSFPSYPQHGGADGSSDPSHSTGYADGAPPPVYLAEPREGNAFPYYNYQYGHNGSYPTTDENQPMYYPYQGNHNDASYYPATGYAPQW